MVECSTILWRKKNWGH